MFKIFIVALIALKLVNSKNTVRTGINKPCKGTRECLRDTFPDDVRAMCLGYYSCKGAKIQTSNRAVCAGANGCTRALFDGTQEAILCSGFKSCQRGRGLTNDNKISCTGFQSCVDVVGGLDAPIIKCDGDLTCSNYKSKKNSDLSLNLAAEYGTDSQIYCNGNGACKDTLQDTDGLSYCDGDGGCIGSRIRSKDIQCQGKRSCKDAILQATDSLTCAGWFGCVSSQVLEIPVIEANGFNALAKSTITLRGIDTTINAQGFRALSGVLIEVSANTELNIFCRGNACKGALITRFRNSVITIDPPECDPDAADFIGLKADGTVKKVVRLSTNCPEIEYVTSDAQAQMAADKFRAQLATTDEYKEMEEALEIAQQEFDEFIDERLRDYEDLPEDEDDDDEDYDDEDYEAYLLGGNVNFQTMTSNNMITSNLLTGIAVFLLTFGMVHGIVQCRYGDYKQIQ